jgi:hypothetical protein
LIAIAAKDVPQVTKNEMTSLVVTYYGFVEKVVKKKKK